MSASNSFSALPMVTCPLSTRDRARVIGGIEQLRQLIGPPGEYGYESRLGIVLWKLYDIHAELKNHCDSNPVDTAHKTEDA